MTSSFKTKDNSKKIPEVEIKTVIQLHSKADNLDYGSLIKILTTEPITKEIAIIVLKKILVNATSLSNEAVKTLQLLISLGANFDLLEDGDGCTALMTACSKGSEELAEFIIQECPDQINKTNKQQRNCLFYAINSSNARHNLELIHKLLKAGVNPNHRENLHGDSSLSLAVKNGYCQISSLLLQYGADPNILLGNNNHTLLHFVCENLNIDLLSILLINRANPFIKNNEGELPIDILYNKLNDPNISKENSALCMAMMQLVNKISSAENDQANLEEKDSFSVYPEQSTEVQGQNYIHESSKISIKEIRNELAQSKKVTISENDDFYTAGLSLKQDKKAKAQIIKFGNNEISPIPNPNDKQKILKDLISVPISNDFSTNEICKKLLLFKNSN